MEYSALKYIYTPLATPGAHTLLLLHGTGGNENDLIPLAKNFGDGYNILSVRGNVSENGMPRFFKRLGMGIFDEDDLRFRTNELVHFIQSIADTEGFDIKKLIALGYSNGANIAGATLVQYPDFLAGAILYRPMQPYRQLPEFSVKRAVPVFISSGSADPTVNSIEIQNYITSLEKAGFKVSFNNLPTGHNLVQQDISLAAEWLSTIL
ncbi:alpha/beta hydrolase [Flavobacterium sp. RHBU_24]|uniref:alpha/beta hydrolase n=1 Tax=Flavobacterium sp. RHBU_24 TaxID=3391185 RepID=UPI0039847E8E